MLSRTQQITLAWQESPVMHHTQNLNVIPVQVVDNAIRRFEDFSHGLVLVVRHRAPAAWRTDKFCSAPQ
jgi:hypothetical protein